MIIIFQIFLALFSPSESSIHQPETCTGTRFADPGDKWLGGDSPWLKRKILPTDNGVAHRTYPLGSRVVITNLDNGRTTESIVIDRGPFGRYKKNGKFKNGVEVFRRALRECRRGHIYPCPVTNEGWRACLDMTRKVTSSIGMRGKANIHVRLKEPK